LSRQKRRRGGGEEHHDERWLITYADMITLLMAFFIMMYSMSVVDLKKFEQLSGSVGHAFGGGGLGAGSGEVAAAGRGLLEGRQGLVDEAGGWGEDKASSVVDLISDQMDASLPAGLRGTVELTQSRERITVSMQANAVIFPIGEATLTPQACQILTRLGSVLADLDSRIIVEGHTCDLPINTPQFPSNWELSTARASAVTIFLVRHCRLQPERIATVGYAATRPKVPNTSARNRARNRRVDIIIPTGNSHADEPARGTAPSSSGRSRPSSAAPAPISIMPPLSLATQYHTIHNTALADEPHTGGRLEEDH